MGLELIYADSSFCEQGVITDFNSFEAVLSLEASEEDNDYHLALPEKVWRGMKISLGEYVYIPGTQWGGPVTDIRHSGSEGTVDIYGICWRGMLCRKIICPPEGETHLVLKKVEANEVIGSLIGQWQNGLFSVEQKPSGILCSGSLRYRNALESLIYLFENSQARLNISFENGKVALGACAVNDHSADLEFSNEYDADIVCAAQCEKANHLIALGRGQLLERSIIEIWRLPNGSITTDPTEPGVPQESEYNTILYDYSGVEDDEQLLEAAKKKLRSAAAKNSMEVELYAEDTELELTDLVSARDTLTGTSRVLKVSGKEIKINSNGISVIYKLSESEG